MKPAKKQALRGKFKWGPQKRKFVAALMQSPRNASLKEIKAQARVSPGTSVVVMRHLRKNMLPQLKKIYFPESSIPGYRGRRSLRSGLTEELERMIMKNPYAQLPTSSLMEKYGFSKSVVIWLASEVRKKHGFNEAVPKGGARVKKTLN